MEFRLLGPLEVSVDGHALPLGGPKQRAVLAHLLLRSNEVVSVDRLIDALWADEPPETARNTLQTYVRHLRRALGGSRIAYRPPGYELVVDRSEVDALRFADLLERGHRLVLSDPAAGVAVLREALAEWRGPALGDLAGVVALVPEIARLESLRLSAIEERIGAELALGRYAAVLPEVELLVAGHPLRERLVAQHMTALYGSGRQAEALSVFRRAHDHLRDELGISPSSELQALHQSILRQEPAVPPPNGTGPTGHPTAAAPPIRNPYQGLRPFQEADSGRFFGREREVSRLVSRLAERSLGSRFLAVVGPSGSGKSSVVSAGLVPALRADAVTGSAGWVIVTMHPGEHPFDELAAALARPDVAPSDLLDLLRSERGPQQDEDAVLPGPAGELLLVIDQFEEVFTLVHDEGERARFLEGVTSIVTDPHSRVRVVVTVRADFYDRPLSVPRFGDLVATRTEALPPLAVEELERAVSAPAAQVGVRTDTRLMTDIVVEFSAQPAALPLLQFALTETFENRENGSLTVGVYRALGGIAGAVARGADELYDRLDDLGRQAVQHLFLRLVTVGEDGADDSRRRVLRSELDSLEVDPAYLSSIIDSYGARRLLTFDRDAATRSATVEVAHEALLHEWGRLRGWLDARREDVRAERRLAAATSEWNEAGQDPSVLLRGDRLARVEAWVGASGMALTRDERAFLDASLALRSAATSAEAARAAREATVERRSKRRLQGMVALFATLAIVAGVLTAVAVGHQRRSELDARIATGRELAAAAVANLDVDPERSILLALEGVAVTDGIDASLAREVREALHRALWRSRLVASVPMGGRVAVSADGTRFATTRADGGATVWDLHDGTELLTVTGHLGAVTAVAFDPAGRDLATVGADGTLRLWDGVTGAQLRLIRVPPATADVDFSPDGRRLGTIDADQTVRLWSLTTGRQERALPDPLSDLTTADVFATLAFSPDGHLVASSRGHAQATVWDVATGRQEAVLTGHDWEVADVAFAPDGRTVATASVDSTAKVWDPSTGRLLATLADHTGDVHSVAYSADGRRIATGATDGIARVWDAESGSLQLTLAGHRDAVGSLGFSPDGERLVTGSGDGSTRLWDITVGGGRDWATVSGPSERIGSVVFDPRGGAFAVTGASTGATIHDVGTGRRIRGLAGHDATLGPITYSPDGLRLAGAAGTGVSTKVANRTVPIWDTETGGLVTTLTGHEDEASNVAFTPDGRRIATSSWDGTVRVWDATTGTPLGTVPIGSDAYALAFSPDGRLLVAGPDPTGALLLLDADTLTRTGELAGGAGEVFAFAFDGKGHLVSVGTDGVGRVWDLATRREVRTLRGHNGPVGAVAVSPDGATIATGGADGTAKLWDADTGREILTLIGHTKAVYSVSFSPDGRLLGTASHDGTVALHPTGIDELQQVARARVTRSLTSDECTLYLHTPTCTTR